MEGGPGGSTAPAIVVPPRFSAVLKFRKKVKYGDQEVRPAGLVARPPVPKSKHKTIFEWADNKDKKKKLELEVTKNRRPPPNFTFIPTGHPELTNLCKEASREADALVYIVSATREENLTDISEHVHRLGYHFRTQIVEKILKEIGGPDIEHFNEPKTDTRKSKQRGDPIPETQEEINKEADAVMRDLFPRIPNTDREVIIRHAFQKGAVFNGRPVVGLQGELKLSRRVQLAVVAHIRHTHTRYDSLLRETDWETARKTVEALCLDTLVKWRGDEETGRDQIDEVLREIVVIDDSEDDDDQEEDEQEEAEEREANGSEEELEEGEISQDEPVPSLKPTEIISLISSPIQAPVSTTQCFVDGNSGHLSRRKTRSDLNPYSYKNNPEVRAQRKERMRLKKLRRKEKRDQAREKWEQARLRVRQQGQQGPQKTSNQASENEGTHAPHAVATIETGISGQTYNQAIYAVDDRPVVRVLRRVSSQPVWPSDMMSWSDFVDTKAQQPTVLYQMARTESLSRGDHVAVVRNEPQLVRSTGTEFAATGLAPVSRYDPLTEQRLPPSFVGSPRNESFREKIIPSIEQAEVPGERSGLGMPISPRRPPQVTYLYSESNIRGPANRLNATNIDEQEHQSKRRRIVHEDLPNSLSSFDGSHEHPLPRQDRPPIWENASGQYMRVRKLVDGTYRDVDLPIFDDNGSRPVRATRRIAPPEMPPRRMYPSYNPIYIDDGANDSMYVPDDRATRVVHGQRPVQYVPSGRVVPQNQASRGSYVIHEDRGRLPMFSTHSHSQSRSHEINSDMSYSHSRPTGSEVVYVPAREEFQHHTMQRPPGQDRYQPMYYPEGDPHRQAVRQMVVYREAAPSQTQESVRQPGRPVERTRPPPTRHANPPIFHTPGPPEDVIVLGT